MNLEDLLYENAPAARDALLSALPPEEECPPDFSPGFHRRLRRLTRRQRLPVLFRTLRQAAACFLALLVLGGAYLGADSQARAGFLRWGRQVYQTQIVYRFAGEAAESGVYRPGWVPEGYMEWKVSEGAVVTAYYVNTDEEIMDFSYGPMQEGAAIAITDTDQAIIKPLEINGFSGTLYLSAEPALSNALIWMDEEKGMFFGISGFLDESDMLHMAESAYLENSTN